MTLPSSGQISFSDINTELGRASDDEMSLSDAEGGVYAPINQNSPDKPDGIAPNSISEWYGYDHNAAPPLTQGIIFDDPLYYPASSGPEACNPTPLPPPDPPPNPQPLDMWYEGTPGIGDTIYADSAGNSTWNGAYQWWKINNGSIDLAVLIDFNGVIQDTYTC